MHVFTRFFSESDVTITKDTAKPSIQKNAPSTPKDNEKKYAENLEAKKQFEEEIFLSTCKDKENNTTEINDAAKPFVDVKTPSTCKDNENKISENFGEENSCDVYAEKSIQVGCSEEQIASMKLVTLNARKILLLYMNKGISLHEFQDEYNSTFSTALEKEIEKCGYSKLNEFLLSVASEVPLKISSVEGVEIIHLDSTVKVMNELLPYNKPSDIASSEAEYKSRDLPPDLDFTQYVKGYISGIANPGKVYTQLYVGDWCSENFENFEKQLRDFYCGVQGEAYQMKSNDIKENVSCMVYYPNDQEWHRGKIQKLISVEEFEVFYVDYGILGTTKIDKLRYIRRDFMEFPAFAMRARLAKIKPVKTENQDGKSWNPAAKQWITEWCHEKELKIRIMDIKDEVLSIMAYETKEDRKIFLHEVLIQENFAEMLFPAEVVNEEYIKKICEEIANALLRNFKNISLESTNNTQPKMFSPSYVSHPTNNQKIEQNNPMIQTIPTSPSSSNQHRLLNRTNMSPTSVVEDSPEVFVRKHLYGEHGAPGASFPTPSTVFPLGRTISLGSIFSSSDVSSQEVSYKSDDNEDFFARVCRETNFFYENTKNKNSLKRITTADGYAFHLLMYEAQPFISSGEISSMIWSNKMHSHLCHELKLKKTDIQSNCVMETRNKEFFILLRRFQVKGIEHVKGTETAYILIVPLNHVIKTLNLFGQPSLELRVKISLELLYFNPNAVCWQESLKKETSPAKLKTKRLFDEDHLNRLCLEDLKKMKEGINFKREQLLERADAQNFNLEVGNELNELNQLFTKVKERIVEVKQVCEKFRYLH